MGTSSNLEYPPKNVELAYFSSFDPKTDSQSTAIIIYPKDNQLRLLVTSLAGGKVAKHFTINVKVNASGVKNILLAARDPSTTLYKIQREGSARIDFNLDGKDYRLSLLQNPRNTDLTNFHLIRHGDSPRHAIRGNFVRVHHSGWLAFVAVATLVAAVVAYGISEGTEVKGEVKVGKDGASMSLSAGKGGGDDDEIEEDPPSEEE